MEDNNQAKKSGPLKPISEIMEEMGFNPQASTSSKASFIKYLAKQAYNVDLEIPQMYKDTNETPVESIFKHKEKIMFKDEKPEQLSFPTLEEYKKVD